MDCGSIGTASVKGSLCLECTFRWTGTLPFVLLWSAEAAPCAGEDGTEQCGQNDREDQDNFGNDAEDLWDAT